jgi:hypothetical protein
MDIMNVMKVMNVMNVMKVMNVMDVMDMVQFTKNVIANGSYHFAVCRLALFACTTSLLSPLSMPSNDLDENILDRV